MYLKSVELRGFKSFADKIYLDFNPGITAIVGPNGSGKSNISDAIRWVMGEQSVKSLRGSRMEDVIFSGTEVRKPQGFAEVSLTLDNSERIFELDFEEVKVTRRVYRSGEGEYFINKAPCRLRDIHELFMDTGLGREGYSIVGQGKIDEILSNKSEDRRQIFEEAAGITKYKYRKNEAEKKLEKTNENLVRLKDIMTELEGQLEPLRAQSEKAKKYLALREQLKTLDVNVSVAMIDSLKAELEKLESDYSAVCGSVDKLQSEANEMEERTNSIYALISDYEQRIEECRKEQRASEMAAGEENSKIGLLKAEREHCKENIKRLGGEIEKSERGMSQISGLISEYQKAIEELKKEGERAANEVAKLDKEYAQKELLLSEKNKETDGFKADVIEHNSQISSLENKIANYGILLENFKNGRESAQKELSEKSKSLEEITAEGEKKKAALNGLEEKLGEVRFSAENRAVQIRKKENFLHTLNEEKNSVLADLSRTASRCSALEDMANEFEGYYRSVKGVMAAHKGGRLKNARIHGPLSSLISADKKFVTAIETALASVSQNIVVENEQDAKAAIEFLKNERLGRATFMPVSTIRGRSVDVSSAKGMQGYIAIASELVTYDRIFEGIVANVLGAVVVADNIDNAIKMAAKCGHRFKIVTLEGDVMQSGGAMSGGSTGKSAGFLSRTAEIEDLKTAVEKGEERLEAIKQKIDAETCEIDKLKTAACEEEARISEVNEEYLKAKAEMQQRERLLQEETEKNKRLLKELETVDMRMAEINRDIEGSKAEILKHREEIAAIEEKVKQGEADLETMQSEFKELQDRLVQASIDKNANMKDTELWEERLAEVTAKKEEIAGENQARTLEIKEYESKITEIEGQIEESEKLRLDMSNATVNTEKELETLDEKRKSASEEVKNLQGQLKNAREQLFSVGQHKAKLEARKTKTETELDGIFSRLWEEYELTYSEAAKLKTDLKVNIAKANKEISELKGRIKALGNINIDAIEEYKDVKERFDFLTQQTADLERAKGELEAIIDEIMGIMKKQFEEQFAAIGKNFNCVFRELFGGGQANLSLADPSDALESGIEIEAQPPGKKLQSLTLLSGGERAFTAIALLFAILKVRPTPFCILDEIEAALDDVNVYRYADYLKKYCKKTQFIVVTHRRGTMEAANILYGVTMQERGISKLLSLNIDEVTQ